jgi:PAS domain S-box-containing protein
MRIMWIGANERCLKWLKMVTGEAGWQLVCVVDPMPNAPAMLWARYRQIPTYTDPDVAFRENGFGIDAVVDAVEPKGTWTVPEGSKVPVIPAAVLAVWLDKAAEQAERIRALCRRQRELELTLNAAHDAMIGVDRTGRVNLFNEAAAKLTGVSVQDALHRRIEEVLPGSRLPRVLATGEPELNRLQRIGQTEVVTNRMPVRDEQGELAGAIAVFRDVTELRQLAAEVTNLREVQTLLEAIIQSTQDAISVVDAEGRGMMINPAYTRLTGLTAEEVIGKPADVDIAEGDSMHMRVLATGQPVRNVPMKVGPMRREVIVNAAPIRVGGEVRGSVAVIHDISEIKRLTEELERAQQMLQTMHATAKYRFDDIVGHSPAMALAIEQARRAAATPATVLLRGESGTGKELFAHAIHNESARRRGPFVRVNCAALSESLLESELFGYEEGAFTGARRGGRRGLFEAASGGTLFLDEIGELSLATQAKLLRALQEREIVRVGGTKPVPVDVRVIAATHVNLEQAVASGRFREDLYYRLNVIPIVIPPLRYRREDIPALVERIVQRHNQEYGRNVTRVTPAALEVLQAYDWPGNVRELENAIGRAMIHMAYGETELDAHHLPPLRRTEETVTLAAAPAPAGRLHDVVRQAERNAIIETLKLCHGNKTEAARRLGISVRALYYKLAQHGLSHGPDDTIS